MSNTAEVRNFLATFVSHFGHIVVAIATSLRTSQSEMSSY